MSTTYTEEIAAKLAALDALAANFGQTLNKNLTAMWLKMLANYSGVEVGQAVMAVMNTYPYYHHLPPFAVLKKELGKLRGVTSAEDQLRLKAEAEWLKVWEATGTYGANCEPDFHPTTACCVRSFGGWRAICLTWTDADRHWRQKEFIERWMLFDGKTDLVERGALALEAHQQAALAGQLAPGAEQLAIDADQTSPPGLTPAENCPDCGGSGWIRCWRPNDTREFRARCRCNMRPGDVERAPNAWTRAILARQGYVFTAPAPRTEGKAGPMSGLVRDMPDRMRAQTAQGEDAQDAQDAGLRDLQKTP